MPVAERKTRACATCFEKKVKCDRDSPCSTCVRRNIICLYSHVEKPRKTPQRNAQRIKDMEARLRSMESLLNAPHESAGLVFAAHQSSIVVHTNSIASHGASEQLDEIDEAFPLDFDGRGLWSAEDREIRHQSLSRQLVRQSLPAMDEVRSLLEEYFDSFNIFFPLFDEDDFFARLDPRCAADPHGDIGWWAAVNIALSIACRMRGMRTLQSVEMNEKACAYLHNALNVVQDLTLRKPDILSIQALLGIAVILQGTPNPRPLSIILAAAVKLSQSLGLNRRSTLAGLSEQQAEQCRRVFWLGYILDKDFSLQFNQPPVQTDLDYDVDLPAECSADGLGTIALTNGQGSMRIFRLRAQLATIQSETYTTLYSVQPSKLSPSARALAVENLDSRLTAWKSSIPINFAPEALLQSAPPGAIVHFVILYMTYFHCLTMIHSLSIRDDYWSASASITIEGTLAGDSISIGRLLCLPTARLAVRLVSLLPRGDYACIWLLLHYYVSAVVILLANIIQHPLDESAATDMGLVEPLLRLLESLTIHGEMGPGDLVKLQEFCRDLEQKALAAGEHGRYTLHQSESGPAYSSMPASLYS